MNKKEKRLMTKGEYNGEKCPRCSAPLLANNIGEKWCSHLRCDYGIINFNKNGMALSVASK